MIKVNDIVNYYDSNCEGVYCGMFEVIDVNDDTVILDLGNGETKEVPKNDCMGRKSH